MKIKNLRYTANTATSWNSDLNNWGRRSRGGGGGLAGGGGCSPPIFRLGGQSPRNI